jgi:hypothetical protein
MHQPATPALGISEAQAATSVRRDFYGPLRSLTDHTFSREDVLIWNHSGFEAAGAGSEIGDQKERPTSGRHSIEFAVIDDRTANDRTSFFIVAISPARARLSPRPKSRRWFGNELAERLRSGRTDAPMQPSFTTSAQTRSQSR